MADKIQNAYEASKNIYDDVLTQGNFFSRMYIKLFWSGTDDNAIARKVLSYIPNDFSGALLDVPVGTAVFTQRKWTALKNAHITCLDYSTDMLEQAEKRLNGQAHIRCVQARFKARRRFDRLFLHPRKKQTDRLACEKHSGQKGLVYAALPDRRRAARHSE